MIPTKTHGICGECRGSNLYTEIHCQHCGARLPWAFLIDGENDEDFEPPVEKSIEHFFHLDRKTPNYNIRCRFCNQQISEDEKICPHCGHWLVAPNPTTQSGHWYGWSVGKLVDPEAPEIVRLTKISWAKKAPEKYVLLVEVVKLLPTRKEGLCSYCSWSNPYTDINCERCGARLAWAYLIDGKDDKDFEPPIEKFFSHLFHLDEEPAKSTARCRYCNEPIKVDEKICPHCENILIRARNFRGSVIDARAPEFQRIYKLYKSNQENDKRWKRPDY